jgi:hypothetical protein
MIPRRQSRRLAKTEEVNSREGVMKKNLVALVVSGVVCGPAIAQTDVTIYGSFNVALERVQREDATQSTVPLNSMVGAPGLTPP